jgi:hypothetical protein
MPKQRKNAIAKTTQSTATTVQTVAVQKDVLPEMEYINSIGTMGVQVGQNTIFDDNTGVNSQLKLTHAGIAEVWNKAWPTRKIVTERGGFTSRHITGALRDYNKGTHGKNKAGDIVIPKTKCGKWVFDTKTHEKKYIGA